MKLNQINKVATARRLSLALAPLLVTFAAGCVADVGDPELEDELVAEAEQPLIGGEAANPGEYDTAGFIWTGSSGCTAARVGPRHILTAAHCVQKRVNNMPISELQDQYKSGWSFWYMSQKSFSTANWQLATVYKTYVHSSWWDACNGGCPNNQSMTDPYPADVAVIVTAQDLPSSWKMAYIGTSPLNADEPVTVVGYGCQDSTIGQNGLGLLKFEWTRTISNSPYMMHKAYITTPGQKKVSSEASLCPGDSGGPLYRSFSTAGNVVVGVNAYYEFTDYSGVSSENMHTRLGQGSQHNVLGFLQAIIPSNRFVP